MTFFADAVVFGLLLFGLVGAAALVGLLVWTIGSGVLSLITKAGGRRGI